MQVNIHEAKTHFSKLVERAAAGEEIVIARAGRPLVKLVPYAEARAPRRLGAWKGEVWIAPDFDAHVLLWALADDSALTRERRAQIEDPANDVFVSAASAWEIEIKRAAGRLRAPEDLLGAIAATGLSPLDVTLEHGVAAGRLPLHHRDPFDRLLIGQAQLEGMALVTHDAALAAYPVAILPA